MGIIDILKPWFKSEEKYIAWLGIIGIIVLSLLSIYVSVLFNEWIKDFFLYIEQKDTAKFLHSCLVFVPIIIASVVVYCTKSYLAMWISFKWRKWYTEKVFTRWVDTGSHTSSRIDNPDQRISNDINTLCYSSITIFSGLFTELINCITFAIILYNISIGFSIFGFDIPGGLVWISIIYSALGTIVLFLIGRPLIGLNMTQEKYEANFRFGLIKIKEYGDVEGNSILRLRDMFLNIKDNYKMIVNRTLNINIFQNLYLSATIIVPMAIAAPNFFSGLITFGVVMQINSAFNQLQSSLSVLITSYPELARWKAAMNRCKYLFEELK